jgi:predicted ATPase/DNA-binding CsgD family transcriptional regulator
MTPANLPVMRPVDWPQLPLRRTRLLGRSEEVAAVEDLLGRDTVGLVTITGPGGVGKTRLALAVAAAVAGEYADGTIFAPLAPLRDPNLALSSIAQALGVREAENQPLADRLTQFLRHKHLLLVLDNLEQVLDIAPHIASLLAASPLVKVLVTSRAPLHLRGEQQFALTPLAVPDQPHLPALDELLEFPAVALFVERAREVLSAFVLTPENADDVVAICARLDGLPLAIELAAARAKVLSPKALLAHLEQRLIVLTGGPRDADPRLRTMRDAIGWSYDLLTEDEQRLFRRLAVFAGGGSVDAIQAICRLAGEPDINPFAELTALIDQSLLLPGDGADGRPRCSMLETVREFAQETLEASGEAEAVRQRHTAYFLAFAEAEEPRLEGPAMQAALRALDGEHDNLRAALVRSTADGRATAVQLAAALAPFWMMRGNLVEGRHWLGTVLAADDRSQPHARLHALLGEGIIALEQGDRERAAVVADESLALSRTLGDRRGEARSLHLLGWVAEQTHDDARTTLLVEESCALFRDEGDDFGLAESLNHQAWLAHHRGDYPRATAFAEESLALYRQLEHRWGIANVLYNLSRVAQQRGENAQAAALAEESAALGRELGSPNLIAAALTSLAVLALQERQYRRAEALLDESVVNYRNAGDTVGCAIALGYLGLASASQRDYGRAAARFGEALPLAAESRNHQQIALTLLGIAGVAGVRGEPTRAARLLGAVDALFTLPVGSLLPPIGAAVDFATREVQSALGPVRFQATWTEGCALSLDRAVAEGMALAAAVARPSAAALNDHSTGPFASLTARELDVLRLLASGRSNPEIATVLVLSVKTIERHLANIYAKIGARGRVDAAAYAMRHDLA